MAAGVDVAPFGKVATWAPQQMGGTKASRVDEMPAEDIYPAKDLLPDSDGTYTVPDCAGTGCIGLRWDENRLPRQLVLRFPSAARVPPAGSIRSQTGAGESAWQGAWQPQKAVLPEKIGSSLVRPLGRVLSARGVGSAGHSRRGSRSRRAALPAHPRFIWTTVDVRIESTRPSSAPKAEIELYNGVLLGPAGSSPYHCTWDPAQALVLKVRSSTSKRYKADCTGAAVSISGDGLRRSR